MHHRIMRHHDAQAVGQIAFSVLVWSSCLPVVSACSLSTLTTSCGFSKQAVIGIIAGGVVFLVICGVCLRRQRRRRVQNRDVRLSRVPFDGMGGRSSYPPKPYNAPAPSRYPMYYPVTPPAPPPVQMPQYPPRGYDNSHSRSQSTARTIPEPTTPMRAPSSIISRPISSLDTTSFSPRSSMRRDDSIATAPLSPSPASPASPRSIQTILAASPLSSQPSSISLRSPSVAIPPSLRPSGTIQPPSAARPPALAPIHTGTSNNFEEPPPAYTPV